MSYNGSWVLSTHVTVTLLYSTSPSPHEDQMLELAQARNHAASRPLQVVALRTAQQDPTDDDLNLLRGHFCNRRIPATLTDSGLGSRGDASDPEVIQRLASADLVIISGGDPRRLYEQTVNTPALTALLTNHQNNAVIAGCSAGAAVLGAGMIMGSDGSRSGMSLWAWFADLLIAPHFGGYDHLAWIDAYPGCTLLGIPDEAMAMISGTQIEALGPEPLTIIPPGRSPQQITVSRPGAPLTIGHPHRAGS